MSEFTEYLKSKKIDPAGFKSRKPDQYSDLENIFDQVHPNSFTAQKLFLINAIRREFPLKEEENKEKKPVKAKMKPKIAPRIKK